MSPEDFVLHLPLRYEDETRVVPIASLRPGFSAQVEGEITKSEVLYRPRRQLTATLADDSGELQLRWLNFYPSQQKQVTVGKRLRARGEVRGGLLGREMVHPRMVNADAPLPTALTPVYPSTEGLPQLTLRRAIAQALDRADLSDTLPPVARERYALPLFEPPSARCTRRRRASRSRRCWNGFTRHGGASSSTSCWRSNCRWPPPGPRGASRKPRRCRPATRRTGWWPGCTKPCRSS